MPEILEIEYYRRAALALVGRRVATVEVDDLWVRDADPAAVRAVMEEATVTGVMRHGKVLLVELGDRPTVGVRFGMTGRLVVDGEAAIDRLEYSSGRDEPRWDRLVVTMDDGGAARVNDPRRLGSVEIEPDVDHLGPDAWTVGPAELACALDSRMALKARLLDQRRLAGLGNLLADEVLWRAGLAPGRPARSLDADAVEVLAATIRATLDDLDRAGGSHRGHLQAVRDLSGPCPADGSSLRRETIGGRTAVWCPHHQV